MKNILTIVVMLISMTIYAQVGINNTSPKATLDITSKTSGTRPEGLIIPQLSGDNIHTATANAVYGAAQKGLIVYASSADTNPTGAMANITAAGYYYFDGGAWQRILETSSGDNTNDGWVNDTTNSMVKLGAKADGTARAAGTDFIVKDNGYVGIGITSPKAALHMSFNNATSGMTSSSLAPGIILTGPTNTGGTGPGLYFEGLSNNTGTRVFKFNLIKDSSGDGILNFRSISDDGTSVVKSIMSLNAKGYVGIETEAPKSFLHVNTPTAGGTIDAGIFSIDNCGSSCTQNTARNIVLNNSNVTNATFASLDFVPSTDPTAASGSSIQGIDRDATNNYAGLSFFTRNATDYNSRMVIKSSGNVGIGTSSPSAKFEINSGAANTSGLKFTNLNSSTTVGTGQALGVDASGNVITVPNPTAASVTTSEAFATSGGFNVNDLAWTTVSGSSQTITIPTGGKAVFLNFMLGVDYGTFPTGAGSSYYTAKLFIDGVATNVFQTTQEPGIAGAQTQYSLSSVKFLTAGSHTVDVRMMRTYNNGATSGQNMRCDVMSMSFNASYIN
jgi:hypothetical protein